MSYILDDIDAFCKRIFFPNKAFLLEETQKAVFFFFLIPDLLLYTYVYPDN